MKRHGNEKLNCKREAKRCKSELKELERAFINHEEELESQISTVCNEISDLSTKNSKIENQIIEPLEIRKERN